MGNYVVKSSQLNSSFAYDNAQVIVNGSFSKDAGSGDLISVHGDVYTNNSGQQGTYIGNFNGTVNAQGEISYDLSAMSRQDSNKVWDAIDELEPYITGENNEE
jgi:hypothetical protein